MEHIYLDNSATTRLDDEVLKRNDAILNRRIWKCFIYI